ncbi:MAG: ComF family protein [bacterium]|nr:ComF family protein [bacterium]
MKYSKKSLIGPHLGGLMKDHHLGAISYDVIVAVPLHISRLRERGFNQSQLLAEGLGKEISPHIDKYILERVRPTGSQTGMSSKERRANVRGAFSLRSGADVSGKRILLIDDVYTTGATVKECSKVLKKGGASVVNVLTLARVVEKNA